MSPDLLVGRYAEPGLIRASTREQSSIGDAVAGTGNVSFATCSPQHRLLYAVREDDDGKIDVLSTEGGLQRVAQVPSGGKQPCHCALDESERYLAVANYGSGEVSLFALDERGIPQAKPWQFRGSGRGPDSDRQASPHAHWVGFAPDQRWLVSTDLGADRIHAFPFNPERGIVGPPSDAYVAPAGSGPRWLAFLGSGDLALLVSELASTLSLLSWHNGAFELLASCKTSQASGGDNLGGHIVVDAAEGFAYVTNRGEDTVATIAITNGSLRLIDAVPSGGASPRYLCWLDDVTLLAAHESEGPITAFRRRDDGGLAPEGSFLPVENVAWLSPF